jgi:hypothetical protein
LFNSLDEFTLFLKLLSKVFYPFLLKSPIDCQLIVLCYDELGQGNKGVDQILFGIDVPDELILCLRGLFKGKDDACLEQIAFYC